MADDPDGEDVIEDENIARAQEEMKTKTKIGALVLGERVLVTVEAALPDIVVVSLEHGDKSFQGALLDATKRGLPCGVQPPEPINGPDSDKLSNIAARFSYFQEKRHSTLPKLDMRRSAHPPPKSKNARPTVRLRPRQVLCSKCRSICNENSENVGRKRKAEEEIQTTDLLPRRSDRRCVIQQQQSTQSHQKTRSQRLLNIADQSDESSSSKSTATSSERSNKFSASIIPKLSRLRPADITGPSATTPQSAGTVKSCIKLAEKMRSRCWNGRNEGDLSQSLQEEEEEDEEDVQVENRPINGVSQPEPMELDTNSTQAYCATPRRLSSSSVESAKIPPEEEDKKTLAAADSTVKGGGRALRAQRKKRSIGLMEDLWDESVFEDPGSRRTPSPSVTTPTIMLPTKTTPVIKISFGTQGEGTVLKIPSKIQHPYIDRDVDTDTEETMNELNIDPLELPNGHDSDSRYEDDGQEQVDPQKQSPPAKDNDVASTKAEKKALKKATKKVWKILQGAVSQAPPVNGSPRYYVNFEKIMHNRRKHKVKRKKRHKEERKHKSSNSSSSSSENKFHSQVPSSITHQPNCLGLKVDRTASDEANVPEPPTQEHQQQQYQQQQQQQEQEQQQQQQQQQQQRRRQQQQDASAYNMAIKEQCLKQKLSISLKRLNTNAYAPCYDHHHSYPVSNTSLSSCKSFGATSDEEEEEEEEEYEESSCMGSSEHEINGAETAPDFPSVEHPLVMRLTAATTQDVVHYMPNGRKMGVGDVVWGKVHGFPWWPGKVLSITYSSEKDGMASGPQAHVAWYGSSTSSLMSCDQLSPFLETFKSRYNKKKKGPYKEAIRQATNEAEARNQIAPNSTSNVLDVCGSPREVNVLS